MLVGDVKDRTVILIDDLADTSNTITRVSYHLRAIVFQDKAEHELQNVFQEYFTSLTCLIP